MRPAVLPFFIIAWAVVAALAINYILKVFLN